MDRGGILEKQKARILFMGTPAFAARVLLGLIKDGWNVVAVVAQPDRPKGRGRVLSSPPVKEVADQAGLMVCQPEKIREPAFIDVLQGLSLDLILVAAYGKILPPVLLGLPRLGCFNVHASLLPAYRGAAPIPWAVIHGETVTGITIFRMDAGMDTGDIVLSRSLPIRPHETAGELAERLAELAVPTVDDALEKIFQGTAEFLPQDSSRATYALMLKKADGRIDWTLHAEEIRNRIRGLDPWPGAYTQWRGRFLKLFQAHTESLDPDLPPGHVVEASKQGLLIRAGRGILRVEEVQLEGGRKMNTEQFFKGHPMKEGEQLG